ncbi:MAG: triose-phosphate isomerase [Alphaproteobacteria bacterium]|nr:MAG: triose-phosphate isomerase [Alphaproteobacteria bacterium]
MARRKLVAGNWKMNGLTAQLAEVEALLGQIGTPECEVAICPPATLLCRLAPLIEGSPLRCGGQDCHWADSGAHTGDISAAMLADCGASLVILGHSERRADHCESSALIAKKVAAAWRAGLQAIVCVGETEQEHHAGQTMAVVTTQLRDSLPEGITADNTVIAYEPVWAIGTGRTPNTGEIAAVHTAIRNALSDRLGAETATAIRILYGGSVKPDNAAGIFATDNVDGGLIGGASLKAADFAAIIAAAG